MLIEAYTEYPFKKRTELARNRECSLGGRVVIFYFNFLFKNYSVLSRRPNRLIPAAIENLQVEQPEIIAMLFNDFSIEIQIIGIEHLFPRVV